ncbi:DNA/pantothenate metabolism flavoprotein [Gorgonomyces haynaldii]|nr:DNA/pantothenate metabolism flavoprotein [Gorgonomyces haynaldii]
MIDPEEFFETATPPNNLQEIVNKAKAFVDVHLKTNRRLVLVTSGGTTVPLESNTVRFLDNFSAGTRGAASAECFLEQGYAVIFLHRQFSLEPYTRHYSHSRNCFLDMLERKDDDLVITDAFKSKMTEIHQKYHQANSNQLLLKIDFTTLGEYLFLLRALTQVISKMGSRSMYYLAAAVSDFFIPEEKMQKHKIQSQQGGLKLDLEQVPKIIKPLVKDWASNGFIVSFKLETDPSILMSKARQALERYGHQIVIGNMLNTRKQVVWFITKDSEDELRLSPEQVASGHEIEVDIIQNLINKHNEWIDKCCPQ